MCPVVPCHYVASHSSLSSVICGPSPAPHISSAEDTLYSMLTGSFPRFTRAAHSSAASSEGSMNCACTRQAVQAARFVSVGTAGSPNEERIRKSFENAHVEEVRISQICSTNACSTSLLFSSNNLFLLWPPTAVLGFSVFCRPF